MNNTFKALVAVAILAIAGLANAQNSASASATANATIICPINIVNEANLNFGNVVSGNGTAHVDNTNSESYTGNVAPGTNAGTHSAAQFNVTGQSGSTYAISMTPASGTLTVTDASGNNPTTVTLDAPVVNAGTPGHLDHVDQGGCSGQQRFRVGGVITLSGQPAGSYSNSNPGGTAWSETVTYN